jgi:hypothetical protein
MEAGQEIVKARDLQSPPAGGLPVAEKDKQLP